MTATLVPGTYNVRAHCENCKAVTSFEQKHIELINVPNRCNGQQFGRILYVLSQCAGCHKGGLAEVSDNGTSIGACLNHFFPQFVEEAALPPSVPEDIREEFREAERCAAFGMNRAASALFRSALEKTLKTNGYTKSNDPSLRDLQKRIDAAAADGVITQARQKRAHEDIRALGNDVLHDDWRQVSTEEVAASHRYTQRFIEDLYDDRATVEAVLVAKGKLQPQREVQ